MPLEDHTGYLDNSEQKIVPNQKRTIMPPIKWNCLMDGFNLTVCV